ncbi:7 transmembrane sweet-taste receptor of 3 GCPR-domain-containing protein [Catenaria anguillulae PL171]|uniref:7 transmembrane sweet-taste receptor of 3 GCPR-domain-containing protein n=1 Tax=Catenaria anguillulae PL171 TaxID=765915 RepID=A0A1Y2HN57_9FUNG|nr:7 transmembrane sweet-taste receptor of 3 GCPR-domain-containing protein [Catenaria anguillulae PL171]
MAIYTRANVTGYVLATLLTDVLGANVTLLEAVNNAQALQRIAQGQSDLSVEIWPSYQKAAINDLVIQKGLVYDLGLMGYTAETNIFVNGRAVDAFPDWALTSWQSYRRPEVLAHMPPFNTTQPAVHPNTGKFLYYSTGIFEQVIVSLNLPLVIVYLGDGLAQRVLACSQQSNEICLHYYWQPELLTAQGSFSPIVFPKWSPDCGLGFNVSLAGTNLTSHACGLPSELLIKVGSPRVAKLFPQAFTLMRYFSLSEYDIMDLLKDYSIIGGSNATEVAACNWIKKSKSIWSRWIQKPPTDYIQYVLGVGTAVPVYTGILILAGILLLLTLASSIGVIAFRQHTLVKAQSPRFMLLILLGQTLVITSVIMEAGFVPRPVHCDIKLWFLSLGFTTIVSSTLVKTSRIYFVFRPNKIAKNTEDKHLFVGVLILVGINAILLVFWSVLAESQVVFYPIDNTNTMKACSANFSSSAVVVATWIIFLFHLLLLVASCIMSYCIRKTATIFNDSKWIGISAYNILLVSVFLLPIVYLPLNPLTQSVIKCLGILFAAAVSMFMLVGRSVVSVAVQLLQGDGRLSLGTLPSGSTLGPSGMPPGLQTFIASAAVPVPAGGAQQPQAAAAGGGQRGRRGSVAASSGPGSVPSGSDTSMVNARVDAKLSMKRLGSILSRWEAVTIALVIQPIPGLLISSPAESENGTGRFFARNITAQQVGESSGAEESGCFVLVLGSAGGGSYLVQGDSPQAAAQWIADIRHEENLEDGSN